MPIEATLKDELEALLHESRDNWENRLERIQRDRRRVSEPLLQDSDDRAIQRENDDTLDALDKQGRRELDAIESALGRMSNGTYADCVQCGETISPARLRAHPAATTCLECAGGKAKPSTSEA